MDVEYQIISHLVMVCHIAVGVCPVGVRIDYAVCVGIGDIMFDLHIESCGFDGSEEI